MTSSPPPGVFVPVPTFFKPSTTSTIQAAIDVETQVAHSIHLARNGVRGLVLLGSTGEAIHMSRQERFDMVSGVRKGLTAAGIADYPIMAGVLINSVDEVLEWLEDFHTAGAQWGLVLAPGYFGAAASQENIREWYTIVADRSPIPILIYNYPGVTNNIIVTPETYRILAQHPNIVGCKMSHGNVSYHVQVSLDPEINHTKFKVYSGFGQQLGPIVLFDAAGVIDGLAAIYPKTVSYLYKLAEKRPIDDATLKKIKELQYTVSTAEEFVVAGGIIGIKEAVQRVLGLGTLEGGRLPLKGRLPDGTWEKWAKAKYACKKPSPRIRNQTDVVIPTSWCEKWVGEVGAVVYSLKWHQPVKQQLYNLTLNFVLHSNTQLIRYTHILTIAPLDDTTAATRFDSFNVYRTSYKSIGDHKIDVGIAATSHSP
ncbi:aldolase [Massarina eburnea CBS 473.64]|uniref:Aldolase n=1 Tax=Massarina eburnea CBS 473.64 TaxID=1395130 RepID=A0A6A6S270_9PLEO|nr:aldolase [Massarina eburnea CBS 473.64]